jgi:hypothetical protein
MTWILKTLDSRGSLNLPASTKHHFGLSQDTTVAFRQVGGVMLLIPLVGEARKAYDAGSLDEWVKQEAALPTAGYIPPEIKSPKRSVSVEARLELERMKVERIRLQTEATLMAAKLEQEAVNARHAQRMEMKNRELEVRLAGRKQRENRMAERVAQEVQRREAKHPDNLLRSQKPEEAQAAIQDELDKEFEREEAQRREQAKKDLEASVRELQTVQLPQAPVE